MGWDPERSERRTGFTLASLWRGHLHRFLRMQVGHAAGPAAGGQLVAIAGRVRFDRGGAIGALVGASPGHVPALALTGEALEPPADRKDRLGGVDAREKA